MSEHEQGDQDEVLNTELTPGTGKMDVVGEGLIVHVQGPGKEGIRTSDSRGWTAAADIEKGTISAASATGIPSHGENLTLDACRILVHRLNQDGATWGEPVTREPPSNGVDCEAWDRLDPNRRPLQMQVVRAEIDGDFWQGLDHDARSNLPSADAQGVGHRVWEAIRHKHERLRARPDVVLNELVLVLNAIRTPWLALPTIVDAFRRLHSQDARQTEFEAIWIVGATDTFTYRLDT